jgi:MerR family transcriptional regulator/heat shock protein HspR
MTAETGLNLAGVERVLELEEELERTRRRADELERRLGEARREAQEARREADQARRSRTTTTEIVLWRPEERTA